MLKIILHTASAWRNSLQSWLNGKSLFLITELKLLTLLSGLLFDIVDAVLCCWYRLDSLTLKRFTVTESLGLDKLTWLRLLHVDDSATSTAVGIYLKLLYMTAVLCAYLSIN